MDTSTQTARSQQFLSMLRMKMAKCRELHEAGNPAAIDALCDAYKLYGYFSACTEEYNAPVYEELVNLKLAITLVRR